MKSWFASLSRICALCGSLALCIMGAGPARAQDQEPDQNQNPAQQDENGKPKPAAHAPIIDTNEPPDAITDPNALRPDDTPLTGLQTPGLGTAEFRHSYWVPGFQVATTAQNGGGNGDWFDTTYVAGNLSLSEAWAHSQLALNYSGGGYFSTEGSQGNGSFQQLGLVQSFHWARWQLDFFDEFSYLPSSEFGFGGLSNIGIPGVGGSLSPGSPGLGGNVVPDQSVLVANGPRYSNTFATQANFLTSRRGSITLAGSYGILRFSDAGNIDNDDFTGSVGYNYAISKKDTVGVVYRFTGYHFTGLPQAIGDHVFNVAYSRRITGRLAVALFGGPEITEFRIPIGTETNHVGVAFGASASYAFERGGVTLSYNHGTTGGSGVVAGATGDNLTASATRQITRQWSGRGNFGYGRTSGFSGNGVSTPAFNSFYFGAGLDRPLGRNALLSFGYTGYLVHQSAVACGGTCSTTFTQHQIAVGFQWHTRPFVLR
jgi:hypothetical protein